MKYGAADLGYSPPMRRLDADLLLLLAAALWGTAFLFQKSATSHVGPLAFIAARCALAALALAPLAWREHRRSDTPSAPGLARDRMLGALLFFVGGWPSNRDRDRHRHQHGLPHRALRCHHADLRLGLERQDAKPDGVARRCVVGARHVAVGRWYARFVFAGRSTGSTLRPCSGRPTSSSPDGLASLRPLGFTAIQFAVVAAFAGLGAWGLETVTFEGLAAAAIDIAYVGLLSTALHLHAVDGGAAAHAAVRSRRHRQL
jgi:hypothetical protein